MAARFAEPTKVEIVGSSWKSNSGKHKEKSTKYAVKILSGKFTKMKKYFK